MAHAPLNSLATGEPESQCIFETSLAHGPYPLTHAQESLWFVEQLSPGTPLYNMPEAWRLRGQLNTQALQQALNRIVERHETLRTFFIAQDGVPRQMILPSGRLELNLSDLSGEAHVETRLQEMIRAEACRPFDLGRAPLSRATLFRISPREHILVLNAHHIIWDAWSQGIFIRELAQIYSSLVDGSTDPLKDLPIQYADFALWQRDMIASEYGSGHLAYWRQQIGAGIEPVLLPTSHSRSRARTFKGTTQFCSISGTLTTQLKELSRRHSVTLFMTLLAGFKALLHRYTGNSRIVVGSPMACRDRIEVESLLGFFVHTQALVSDLGDDPGFGELVGRVREAVLNGYAHQDVPCELSVKGTQGPRLTGTHPLFQVVFGWQNASPHNWNMVGIEAEKIELETGTSKFDWTVLVTETPHGLDLRSEFSTELFDAPAMDRLMSQFQTLLQAAADSSETRISRLQLEPEAERSVVIEDWNRTATRYESNQQIQSVFEAQAARAPESVALEFCGGQMTYGDLNRRANQLMWRLRDAGVRPGSKVGILVERSFELVVAMLAILKAGAAYVPLDPNYPRERLEWMIRDCSLAVVLSQRRHASILPESSPTLCLETLAQECLEEKNSNPEVYGNAEEPAYIMYTSGSTGVAKGAVISHRGVVRLVRNTNYLDFSSDQVFLQFAPATFDASTFEIWGALLNGARLVIFPPELSSLKQLGRIVRERGITTLWLTAGLFHQMVDNHLDDLRGLKYLLAGGDVLSPAHVSLAARFLPGCQLINGYGPTENTTFTCCYRLGTSWPTDKPVPIGRPISNTTVYVLDKHMQPVPTGVPGELYVGGDGLALEYLNQPDLTREKFVPNPFGDASSPRLYRTGDLVRWSPDGNLEFLGRADQQVKIRGYRVEPGEVEQLLSGHPSIAASAVIVKDDAVRGKCLVAYIVRRAGCAVQMEEVRQFLQAKLPTYMVPSHFVELQSLPLTANGKVDRRALPEPDRSATLPNAPLALPQTPDELLVWNIWREVLGLDQFGIHDDFFHLGGHSLLATQVIFRLGKACNVDVPVIAIFEAPTVAKLAITINRVRREQHSSPVPSITASGATRAAELLSRLDEISETELEELLRDPELKSVL